MADPQGIPSIDDPRDRQRAQDLADWLTPAFLLLIIAGTIVLRLPANMVGGNQLSIDRAFFSAVNAATLTGFPQTISPGDYLAPGQYAMLALTIGGTLFSLIAGSLAVVRILKLRYTTMQVVAAACMWQIAVLLLGAIIPIDRHGILQSIVLSASAFANSGVYIGSLPQVDSLITHTILLPLAILGGLGLPVLMEGFDWIFRNRPTSKHTRVASSMSAGVYVFAIILLIFLQRPTAPDATLDEWRHTLALNSTLAINSRSGGFPFEFATTFSRPIQWITIALMIFGACPAGTGGGLKTTTIYELFCGSRRLILGQTPSRSLGIAIAWTGIYALIIALGTLILLSSQPQIPADRVFFLVVSAAGNVGLSHDAISITQEGLFALSAVMLAGRVAPVMILWWMASLDAEADVAVG